MGRGSAGGRNLTCGDSSIVAKIDRANDVPLVGAADDRFKRMEGYVRRWQPMDLGRMELKAGRQTLKLRAIEVAGEAVADMRLLMFRRIE